MTPDQIKEVESYVGNLDMRQAVHPERGIWSVQISRSNPDFSLRPYNVEWREENGHFHNRRFKHPKKAFNLFNQKVSEMERVEGIGKTTTVLQYSAPKESA